MAKAIKTDEERARLDELFAQVEKELYVTVQEAVNQHETDVANFRASLEKKKHENAAQTITNVSDWIKSGCFKTKREEYLANAYYKLYNEIIPKNKKEYGSLRTELEHLRNFAKSVSIKLQNAEKTAKEQDNHHYYKIFAESVKILLDNI